MLITRKEGMRPKERVGKKTGREMAYLRNTVSLFSKFIN
jgi:hypothetical protein